MTEYGFHPYKLLYYKYRLTTSGLVISNKEVCEKFILNFLAYLFKYKFWLWCMDERVEKAMLSNLWKT